jgi:poly-beta-hydroxyalkanoate depolymerase
METEEILGRATTSAQAGVRALVATAYHSHHDQGCAAHRLVVIAAPIDPAANPTRVSRLIRARTLCWYEHNVVTEITSSDAAKGGLVHLGSMQLLGLWAHLAPI